MKNKIDRLLREWQPRPRVSQELHESIMQSVAACQQRDEAGEAESQASLGGPTQVLARAFSLLTGPRLAFGLALIAIVTAATFFTVNYLDTQRARTAAAVPKLDPALTARLQETWNFLDEVGTNAPALITRPITERLNQLSTEFHKTTDVLLASLPQPQGEEGN